MVKWRARTVCSEDLIADDDGRHGPESQLAERCSNFSVTDDGCVGDDESDELQPDPVTGEVPKEPTGCGAFVPSRPVIPAIPLPQEEENPLLATPGGGATPLPQGPQPPPADEEELPPGAEQLGLPGAPPGTVPPGTAPPGTAPPGAPPTGAPRRPRAHRRRPPPGGLSVSGDDRRSASQARRDHPPPAGRVPLGSRAGRALDRPAHGRGGVRAGGRSGAGRRRKARATSSATSSFRSTSWRCSSRSAARAPSPRSPRG